MKTTNDYYCGIRGVRFIWHGVEVYPEVSYKGYIMDEIELTDYMWQKFARDNGWDESLSIYDEDTGGRFTDYVREHAREVKAYIMAYGRKIE